MAGATVDEIELALSEFLHHPFHRFSHAGQLAAHVIADPANMGDMPNIVG